VKGKHRQSSVVDRRSSRCSSQSFANLRKT
jgi:hypothetical protein